jgi:hypothetical protein
MVKGLMFLNCHLRVFFLPQIISQKNHETRKAFFGKLNVFVINCLKLIFHWRESLWKKFYLPWCKKTLVDHVQPTLNGCLSITCTFQHSPLIFECWKVHVMYYSILWCPIIGSLSMSIVNYLRQLITFGVAMVARLWQLLDKFSLFKKLWLM